jgi:hypothetical protein
MIRVEVWGYICLFNSLLLSSLSSSVLTGRWQLVASIVAILLSIVSVVIFDLDPMATKN